MKSKMQSKVIRVVRVGLGWVARVGGVGMVLRVDCRLSGNC